MTFMGGYAQDSRAPRRLPTPRLSLPTSWELPFPISTDGQFRVTIVTQNCDCPYRVALSKEPILHAAQGQTRGEAARECKEFGYGFAADRVAQSQTLEKSPTETGNQGLVPRRLCGGGVGLRNKGLLGEYCGVSGGRLFATGGSPCSASAATADQEPLARMSLARAAAPMFPAPRLGQRGRGPHYARFSPDGMLGMSRKHQPLRETSCPSWFIY